MFPFKKKEKPEPVEVPKPDRCDEVRRSLDETETRLGAALREMRRRLAEREIKFMEAGK